jgi:hypothetical protein
MGLIERQGNALIHKETNLHLPQTSPLYRAWRNQLKLLTIHKLNANASDSHTYSFATIFTATESVKKKIHKGFLELLSEVESEVKNSPAKGLFQMSFDLFSWAPGDNKDT